MKKKIAIFSTIILLIGIISLILGIKYNQKEKINENPTTTTIESKTKTQATTTPETKKETSEATEIITTTEEQIITEPSYYSNKIEEKTTTKQTITTITATEEPTLPPDYYNKDKFPEGYTVTENPHYSDSTKGAYWVCGSVEFHWYQIQDEDIWVDEYGNEIEKPCYWSMSRTSWSGMASTTQTEKLKNILYELEPPRDGQYIGEVYEITIWAWLPE